MKHWYLIAIIGMSSSGVAGCAVKSSASLAINEVEPSNSKDCADEVNERNDWVELYNKGDEAVNLGGYSITDDTASPRKSILPDGLMIEAKGVVLLWADGTPDQGKTHLKIKFSSKGEGVTLYDPDEKQIDQFRWTDAVSDVSFARIPDGTGAFQRCQPSTCGTLNGASCGK